MKSSLFATLIIGATVAIAQSAGDLPQCSLSCFLDNVQKTSGCELTDYPCQCQPDTQKKLNDVIGPCVIGACSQDDALKTNSVVQGICKAAVGDSSMTMTPTGTMSDGVSATFTSLTSVGALGGGNQVTPAATSDSAVSLNGGVAGSTSSTSSMISRGPQADHFTAGAPVALPTGLAVAVGGLAGLAGALVI